MMKIMKIGVVCLLLLTTCFAVENTTTELEQKLKVQKRDKQYLIEDDPNEGPEQKRDERQSSLIKNNNNLDPKGNSRIINIRIKPNILTAPIQQGLKPAILQKPINSRIDTAPIPSKIPVILKTAKVIPGPAHALRLKMLQNKIKESSNTEKKLCQNIGGPSISSKDNIPYFTIEDKTIRKTEGRSGPITVDDDILLGSNVTVSKYVSKETDNDGNNALNKDNKDQVPSNTDRKANSEVVQKPVPFFVDEPEPLPPSIRKQYLEMKPKEIPIVKTGKNKHKKDEIRKLIHETDDSNESDVVQISNGTHLISIKKIPNYDRYKLDAEVLRSGEEDNALTEERIVNQPPPKQKPIVDEPEKHSIGFRNKEKNVGLSGLVFKDDKMNEKDPNDCITITNRNYEEFEEKSPISPTVTIQQTNSPTTSTEAIQEPTWNYLQNPYYNPSYQNIYDQYRRNYGSAHITPNIYGQETNCPRNYGVQINPCIYSKTNTDPFASDSNIILPYYPNGYPPVDADPTQYPYYRNQLDINNIIYPDVRPENTLDRIWTALKDAETKLRNAQTNDADDPDIDIRREGKKPDNMVNKVVNPYVTSSLPINVNGALIYPYVNPGSRYVR